MPKLENIDAPSVLGITEQQLNLLKTVYKLTSKNKTATPREIEHTYRADHNTHIQTSNLFRQLKTLLDKQFLTRENEADYRLNIEGIKKTLDSRKQEYHTKLEHYEQLTNQLEEYFRKATATAKGPVVEYLTYDNLFNRIADSIGQSERYYATGKFPNIVYKRQIVATIGRTKFWDVLHKRCFDEGFEVIYLTGLDLDSPYNHALKFYKNHEKAYRETERIIDDLFDYTERFDNLRIMYLKAPYGLDILIPENKAQDQYYQFIRDDRMNIIGGIYIKSLETALQAKETYMSLLNTGTRVKGHAGERIIQKLKEELKRVYGSKKSMST